MTIEIDPEQAALKDLDFDVDCESDIGCENPADFMIFYKHHHNRPTKLLCAKCLAVMKTVGPVVCIDCNYFAARWTNIVENIERVR